MSQVIQLRSRNSSPFSESPNQLPTLPARLPRTGEYLFNRELSLLGFFRRVLEEAFDESQPLLERLKFLSIFSSNLDEFFMIRVSGLQEEAATHGGAKLSPDGTTPAAQLLEIRRALLPLIAAQSQCLRQAVLPGLAAQDVVLSDYAALTAAEKERLADYFRRNVFPILTPQAVDPAHPFPYISGQSLNLGLMVKPEAEPGLALKRNRRAPGATDERFVRVKVPSLVPRLIPVGDGQNKFVRLEELIAAQIATLFPGMCAGACFAFRVTRDADIEVREEEAEDLLASMEQTLRRRRFGSVVRLEVAEEMPQEMLDYLTSELELTPQDVYRVNGILDVTKLMSLYKIDRPGLKDAPLQVARPACFATDESTFDLIKREDILLHHPYMPYDIVTDFIREAARDSDVVAIKICLYRTGANSPIPPALIEAAERGKQVTALVELKARFDEEHNIQWAKKLEEAGVHVVYGVLGLKTHCKVTLVIRREDGELKRYVHLATGNYNPETSAFYTDLGLLTANEAIGADATEVFNYLTGYSQQDDYRELLVAPVSLRRRMTELIERETAHAAAGRPARIIAKLNRLADAEIIRALYAASQAGVKIQLIVRGVCMLRPGIRGLSENIEVRSIVGRLLEHSRVYYFENDGAPEVYLGSADWMSRNLDRRVEIIAPVHDEKLRRYLKETFLAAYLRDNTKASRLLPDGSYERIARALGAEAFNSQLFFQRDGGDISYQLCERTF